ncbi:MAG: SDR family oxidoreductase [Pseudomonadales bacterium]|nr:SDR family oxidoreductase [Pseudomonadales bacterium]MCP5184595.1 SDR family oxidoreductase [Pseudomonadales bacterium]
MKTLVITGASSGIGLRTAAAFLDLGYEVVNLSRRRCPLDKVTHVNCDLSQPGFMEVIAPVMQPMLERSSEIALIHNASRLTNDSAVETPSNTLRAVLEVNVVAPNSLNYFVIPYMKPGSSILFVASTLAEKAVPGSFCYVTSKHATIGMMRALTQDLAGRGIHTAAVCPGFTDTEMLRQHVPADAMDIVRNMSAFGRLITPDEIADTLVFAARSPVLNGAVIHASLGQVER